MAASVSPAYTGAQQSNYNIAVAKSVRSRCRFWSHGHPLVSCFTDRSQIMGSGCRAATAFCCAPREEDGRLVAVLQCSIMEHARGICAGKTIAEMSMHTVESTAVS